MTSIKMKPNASAGMRYVSHINHKNRTRLGLSCDEYVIMEYVHERVTKGKPLPTLSTVMQVIGFTEEEVMSAMTSLCSKGMYEKGKGPTDKWNAQFDFTEEFEQFWEIFLKNGNKATAKEKYVLVRKQVERDVLFTAAANYIKSKEGSERKHILHASTWLNPEKKHWEDVVELEQKKVYTTKKLLDED